jgi:hypothetical protein
VSGCFVTTPKLQSLQCTLSSVHLQIRAVQRRSANLLRKAAEASRTKSRTILLLIANANAPAAKKKTRPAPANPPSTFFVKETLLIGNWQGAPVSEALVKTRFVVAAANVMTIVIIL